MKKSIRQAAIENRTSIGASIKRDAQQIRQDHARAKAPNRADDWSDEARAAAVEARKEGEHAPPPKAGDKAALEKAASKATAHAKEKTAEAHEATQSAHSPEDMKQAAVAHTVAADAHKAAEKAHEEAHGHGADGGHDHGEHGGHAHEHNEAHEHHSHVAELLSETAGLIGGEKAKAVVAGALPAGE